MNYPLYPEYPKIYRPVSLVLLGRNSADMGKVMPVVIESAPDTARDGAMRIVITNPEDIYNNIVIQNAGGGGGGGSVGIAVPTSNSNLATAVLATPGTPQKLIAGVTASKGVLLTAPDTNSSTLWIGGSDVSAVSGSEKGYPLLPGDKVYWTIDDASKIYFNGLTAGDKLIPVNFN